MALCIVRVVTVVIDFASVFLAVANVVMDRMDSYKANGVNSKIYTPLN